MHCPPKKFIIAFLLVFLLAGTFLYSLLTYESPLPSEERRFPVMGTVCQFRLTGEEGTSPEMVRKAADAVQDTFYRIEKLCNVFDEKSALSRINRALKNSSSAKCPENDLWEILLAARYFYRYSGGAFDVTIGPLMRLWGFYRKKAHLPSGEEITVIKKSTGLDHCIFDDTKQIKVIGMGCVPQFDLGGIAKGYALDKAAETAAQYGIKRGLLDLGGNLRTLEFSSERKEKYHLIGIRDPKGGSSCAEKIKMPGNMSISTSGNYERYVVINNIRYTHILDGRTGIPVSGMLSVTVMTPEGIHSDALSTAIFILGENFAEKVYKDFPDTSIVLFREEKGQIIRKGWGRFAR